MTLNFFKSVFSGKNLGYLAVLMITAVSYDVFAGGQEAAEAAAAEAARTEYELVQSATALIQQVVQENWSRPPSARNGMRAVLQIRMLPTGELVDANITQSSGDPAFDRSAETAVIRAAPFSELQDLPINVFNANFRSLSLIFEPEDLLN